jgi:hypothetical protein
MTTDIDTREIQALEKTIEAISSRAIPIAIQQTLSNTARNAYNNIQQDIGKKFVIKNKWTARSMSHQRATGLNVDKMAAHVGSVQDYMAKQESGFSNVATGQHGVQVPTGDAAGQPGARRRTRVIKKRFRKNNIELTKSLSRRRGNTPAQQRIASIIDTMRAGKRFWFGELNKIVGMWHLKGGRISKKGGWPRGMRPKLLYSANHRRNEVKSTRWLEPASEKALKDQTREYGEALARQLNRLKKAGRG